LCRGGPVGQKTGAGFYRYEAGSRNASRTHGNRDHRKVPQAKGITARKIGNEEIVERCHLRADQRGRAIVEDGIAQRSSDIDIVYLNGYGFPPWRGRTDVLCRSGGIERGRARDARHCAAAAGDKAFWTPRRCWPAWLNQAKHSAHIKDQTSDRSRHRIHRAHRAWQELEGRIQHDLRRHLGRAFRAARGRPRRIDPAEVEDVIMGSTFGEGTTGGNIARQIALRAGLPITTAGLSINRFCSSGLQSIALAAQRS